MMTQKMNKPQQKGVVVWSIHKFQIVVFVVAVLLFEW